MNTLKTNQTHFLSKPGNKISKGVFVSSLPNLFLGITFQHSSEDKDENLILRY